MWLLVAVAVIGIVAAELIHRRALGELQVNGPYYARIVEAKDLVADILPPPEYAVEAYLVLYRIMNENEIANRTALVKQFRELERTSDPDEPGFEDRHEYWLKQLNEDDVDDLKKIMTVDVYQTGKQFFKQRVNPSSTRSVWHRDSRDDRRVQRSIRRHFEEHRAAVDHAVKVALAHVKKVETESKAHADGWNRASCSSVGSSCCSCSR